MATSFEDIKDSALCLDLNSRAALAKVLLESLETPSDAENEALWLDEAERRQREVLAGSARLQDGDEVFQRVAASFE